MATTGALIPEVERALVRAVSLNVPADRRRRRRRVGVLSCAAVLVVGATAIAATSWLPELGNDQLGHPSASQSPAPSAQSGHLAVLRSPQTEGDRSTDVEDAFRVIGSHELDGVRLDDVRVLHRGTAGLAVLVPVERSGSHDSGHPSTEVEDSLCVLFSASPPASANRRATGVVGQKCGSGADLLDGKIVSGNPGADGQFHVHGLVPDGVATVELALANGQTIAAGVERNYFNTAVDGPASMSGMKIRWLDDAGGAVGR